MDNHGSDFAWNQRIPVLARVLPKSQSPKEGSKALSLINNWPENVQLVKAFPRKDANELILHVRETQGIQTTFALKSHNNEALTLHKVNVLGEAISTIGNDDLKPLESAFYILKID